MPTSAARREVHRTLIVGSASVGCKGWRLMRESSASRDRTQSVRTGVRHLMNLTRSRHSSCATHAAGAHSVGRMPMTYKAVRRALARAGWVKVRQRGSHEVWEAGDGEARTMVAGKDSDTVPAGTLAGIRQQTGMDELR